MPKIKKGSRTKHLLRTLNASRDGKSKSMNVSDAAHASYIDETLRNSIKDARERSSIKRDLMRKRLDGQTLREQADIISKMKKGGRMKAVKTYKKGGSIKDACYHKVKAGEKVFPSAYASGRIAKCRKMGAANYGKGKK